LNAKRPGTKIWSRAFLSEIATAELLDPTLDRPYVIWRGFRWRRQLR